jgi:hypothetical protein
VWCRYHLKDVIVGKIYFLLVRIKIKHMELSIIRRETTGAPPNQYNESETITKFEVSRHLPFLALLLALTTQPKLTLHLQRRSWTEPRYEVRLPPPSPLPNRTPSASSLADMRILHLVLIRFGTGETIPIRLFLGGFELTPTFRDVNKKFSARYYLNLVLIDEENRRYFKQNEITIVRLFPSSLCAGFDVQP